MADLRVAKSGRDGAGDDIPGTCESPQGPLDLVGGRTVLACDPLVRLSQPLAELPELSLEPLPRVGSLLSPRIGTVRVHLLDGTYELFRAHYGRRDTVIAPDGHDIHATLGILESTLALLREPGVTHLAASFDTVIESFRNLMFPGYKSSAGMDPELLRQFPFAEDALEAIGVVVWRNIEFEADDAIAAAAVRWADDVDQVVIVSPDKDMSQVVVGDRIVTYNRREQRLLDEEAVVAKFGIHPESIPDYLALVGDSADGVPGIPGWGAKSASAVLSRFHRLEMIPDDAAAWGVTVRGGAGLAATLAANRDLAYLYRELTTLRLDAPIEHDLPDLEWKGVPEERFRSFCASMNFDADAINVHRWAA